MSPLVPHMTLPNALTFLRILLAPLVVILLWKTYWAAAAILFLLASLTDWLDGFLARRLKQTSSLGQILDPLADKVLLMSVYGALYIFYPHLLFFPFWFVVLLVGREIIFLSIAGFYFLKLLAFSSPAQAIPQQVVAPIFLGKLNTFFQMGYVFWVICFTSSPFLTTLEFWAPVAQGFICTTTIVSTLLYGVLFLKDKSAEPH